MRTKLTQSRATIHRSCKITYTVNLDTYTSQYPPCLTNTHDTNHLFNCSEVPTQQHATSRGKSLLKAAAVIQEQGSRLAFLNGQRTASPR